MRALTYLLTVYSVLVSGLMYINFLVYIDYVYKTEELYANNVFK